MEDNRLIETDEDREDFGDEEEEEEEEQDEEYEEGEEVAESIRVARIIHRDLIENEDDEDEDEDYEDDDDEEEDYEEEEIEDLILVRMPSQGAEVINNDFLDDLNNLESCEGKRETSEGEIGGLFCPICFQAWTSGGEHRIWYDEANKFSRFSRYS